MRPAATLNLRHLERDEDADPSLRAEKMAQLDQASVGHVNAYTAVAP
jgi:hypothetical protein